MKTFSGRTVLSKSIKSGKKIMIVCGESSGDLHGAYLVKELFLQSPKSSIFGIGGKNMRREGFSAFLKSEDLSFMGITDVIANYGVISEAKKTAEFLIREEKPELLILIDYPGFNLRLAEYAKKRKIKVLYYISPKIWAWNMKRIKKIKENTDHVALILPFEKEIYNSNGIDSTFVGNPLLDYEIPEKKIRDFQKIKESPVIGLLPGSRPGEVKRHLELLLESAVLTSKEFRKPQFIISSACMEEKELLSSKVHEYRDLINIKIENNSVYNIFEKADFLVAASGTVTLEAAVSGVPMIIIYRVSPITYFAGRMLVKTPFIGLASIIAGKEVIPELIQGDAAPEKIKDHVLYHLKNEEVYNKMIKDLRDVKHKLGEKGVAKRTAELAIKLAGN